MSGNNKTSGERVFCEQDGCSKDYASKSGMKEHMKKNHQNVVLSMVQDVVNFLSPQPTKNSEPINLTKSPKALFVANENEEDDEVLYIVVERHDVVEALKLPIIPGGDWLKSTLPSGDLDKMLNQVHSHKQVEDPQTRKSPNVLTCAQCMLGKEEIRKQTLLHKADKQAKRTLQKEYKKLETELSECRMMLNDKTKEVVVLAQRLKTKESAQSVKESESEVVEEVVEKAGDYKTCECCGIKVKGVLKLIKHQQIAHLTCTMCPEEAKWVGLSIDHLKLHHQNTHKVRTTKQKCDECKLIFPDAMAKNVHTLKEHSLKCTFCSEQLQDKKQYDVHMKKHNKSNNEKKDMKCIACNFKTGLESDLTKHYESKHIHDANNQSTRSRIFQCNKCKDNFNEKKYLDAHVNSYHKAQEKVIRCKVCQQTCKSEAELTKHYEDRHINNGATVTDRNMKCRNGPSCSYLKANRCSFEHAQPKRAEQWQTVQQKRHVTKPLHEKHHQASDGRINVCKNGSSCGWHKYGKCNFFHNNDRQPLSERSQTKSSDRHQDAPPIQQKQCRWGANCHKGMTCGFLHLAADFQIFQERRRK